MSSVAVTREVSQVGSKCPFEVIEVEILQADTVIRLPEQYTDQLAVRHWAATRKVRPMLLAV